MATDPFSQRGGDPTVSARNAALVTPDDDTNLVHVTRGLSFGTAGDLMVTLAGTNTPIIIPSGALAAGVIHPLQVKRVWASGTAATDLVAYW